MEGCHTHTMYKRRDGSRPMYCKQHRSAAISQEVSLCAERKEEQENNQDAAVNAHPSSGNASDANVRLVPPEIPFFTLDQGSGLPRGGRGRPPSQTCHFAEGCARQPVTLTTSYHLRFQTTLRPSGLNTRTQTLEPKHWTLVVNPRPLNPDPQHRYSQTLNRFDSILAVNPRP